MQVKKRSVIIHKQDQGSIAPLEKTILYKNIVNMFFSKPIFIYFKGKLSNFYQTDGRLFSSDAYKAGM